MKITVRFFSEHRKVVGKEKIEMNISKDTKISDILDILIEEYPELNKLRKFTLVSLNHEYSGMDDNLKEEDELAFFPPVGGG